jgi:invasion protein IalB
MKRRILSKIAGALGGASAALAAIGAAAQDAAPEEGDRLLTTYQSWALRCVPRENAAPCDIIQTLNDRESGAQVTAFSLAYSADDALTAVQIIAPLGVHLPKGLTMVVGPVTAPRVRFTRCELAGCFVEGRLGEDVLGAMQSAETLKLTFGLSAENDVTLDVDLAGFAEAYAALVAETVARSAPPPEE